MESHQGMDVSEYQLGVSERRQSLFYRSSQPQPQESDGSINLNAYENSKSAEDNSEPLQLSAQKAVIECLRSVEADS